MHCAIGRPGRPPPDHRHHNPLESLEGGEGELKEWFDVLVGSAFRILSVRWEELLDFFEAHRYNSRVLIQWLWWNSSRPCSRKIRMQSTLGERSSTKHTRAWANTNVINLLADLANTKYAKMKRQLSSRTRRILDDGNSR